ncbi:MAG TPA: hypothetical protein VK978_03945 [Candidatus Saccharimonadales bacterium]|nr:hypothetical protein [Candidatus Saccharimonadales bacterium]
MQHRNIYQLSEYVRANIAIAEQLLALTKNPAALDQCSVISYELSNIQDAELDLQVPFMDIHLYIGFLSEAGEATDNSFTIDMRKKYLKDIRKELRELKQKFNPNLIKKDKEALDMYILPILRELVHAAPKERPDLFLKLCRKAIKLVDDGTLSIYAAASDIHHTLDRPEIYNSRELIEIVRAAQELEKPGLLRQGDPQEKWLKFAGTIPV